MLNRTADIDVTGDDGILLVEGRYCRFVNHLLHRAKKKECKYSFGDFHPNGFIGNSLYFGCVLSAVDGNLQRNKTDDWHKSIHCLCDANVLLFRYGSACRGVFYDTQCHTAVVLLQIT